MPPKNWKKLQNTFKNEAEACYSWIQARTILTNSRSRNLIVGTTLMLGPETELAKVALANSIPYKVFLPCSDLDRFWDTENKRIFNFLLKQAEEVVKVSDGKYYQGCIKRSLEKLHSWLQEEDYDVLVVRHRNLTKLQKQAKRKVEESNGRIYYFSFPRNRSSPGRLSRGGKNLG